MLGEAWGMLGNASGRLWEAWGMLGNALGRLGDAWGRLEEFCVNALGSLGEAWGILGNEAWGGLGLSGPHPARRKNAFRTILHFNVCVVQLAIEPFMCNLDL